DIVNEILGYCDIVSSQIVVEGEITCAEKMNILEQSILPSTSEFNKTIDSCPSLFV
ncbi:hypothetical protein ACJMK2_026137, partial [Sinanodonta woodiana]